MSAMRCAMLVAALLWLASPAAAFGLGEAGEAEAARHHARAGGPTNDRDAELLRRYGCFASTDSDFCRRLALKPHVHRHKRARHKR